MADAERTLGEFWFPKGLLNLDYTLSNGQIFRWRKGDAGWWEAVTTIHLLRVRLAGSDTEDHFEFQTFPGEPDLELVRRFFRFDVDLETLYSSWQEADPHLSELTTRFLANGNSR